MSASSHDLVIVGAGFAGLACARAAAVLGLRVVVVERKHDPGAGCRTTGILVKEAAQALEVPRHLTRQVRGVRLYSPSLAFLDLTSPGYYFLATDTPALLRWLAQEAEAAGAEILLGTPYRGARRVGGGFKLSGTSIHARFLAGADGPRSRVARDFGLGANQSFLTGVEIELDGVRAFRGDRLHCFLDSRLAPGYIGWVVPGVGVTQVGIAASRPERARLDPFLERLKAVFPLGDARVVGRRAGLIPVNGPVNPIGADGLLLLGDAAGWVSPLTGGGLYNALHFGRLAGHAIAQYLLENGPLPHLELSRMLPRYGRKRVVRLALELAPPNWMLDALVTSPPFRALARRIFFHHRGILSRDATRELAASPAGE